MKQWWGSTRFRAATSAILLSWFLARTDLRSTAAEFRRIPVWALGMGVIASFIALWLGALKWRLLLPARTSTLFRYNIMGQYYSLVVPGQIGGDVARGLRLIQSIGRPGEVAASVAMDRVLSLLGLLLVGISGVALGNCPLGRYEFLAGVGILCMGVIAALFVARVVSRRGAIASGDNAQSGTAGRLKALREVVLGFVVAISKYLTKPMAIGAGLALSTMYQALCVLVIVVFARFVAPSVSVWDLSWVSASLGLALVLPITIGGLGVREATLAGLLGYLGVQQKAALAISAGLFLVHLSGACIGLILDLAEKIEPISLREE